MPDIKLAFAGSPEFAAIILKEIAASPFRPCAVFTQPDRPQGRGRRLQANPVKRLANDLGLPVHQPETLKKKDAQAALSQYELDVLIVAAYGLILPQAVLDIPRYGCLNVHASLLPRWRGAAPIERAIMAGDETTGICIMQMEAGLDTGPVLARKSLPIVSPVDMSTLERSLAEAGASTLLEQLAELAEHGRLPDATPQDDAHATYADKITSADREIEWSQPAADLARRIQALAERLPVRVEINNCGVQLLGAQEKEQGVIPDEAPLPGTIVDVSKKGIVVQCATNLLQITSVRVERGKGTRLDAAAALNGFSDLFHTGAHLT